jgi:hypothetical protein
MFVSCVCCVCRVGSGLCNGLVTRSEDSYQVCVRVSACTVIYRIVKRGGLGPIGAVAPQKRNYELQVNDYLM